MADFIQNSQSKNAVRVLASPIADITAFNQVVQSVITDNPFSCIAYMTAGVNHPPVEKTRESYTVRIVYEDSNARNIGSDSARYNTIAGFTAGATALLASAANIAAHGGTAVRDSGNETFSATLRCHDANGELYSLTFGRDRLTLTSYSDDAILSAVETWADMVPALA
jgi:hypothetical protein